MSKATYDSSSSVLQEKSQRKIIRSHDQLKRGQACAQCKKRRIKCDADRPHCSSCVRSYHFLARTCPDEERDGKGVQCDYADAINDTEENKSREPHDASVRTAKRKAPETKTSATDQDREQRETIRELEKQVANLQKALKNESDHSLPSITSDLSTSFTYPVDPILNPNSTSISNFSAWTGVSQTSLQTFPSLDNEPKHHDLTPSFQLDTSRLSTSHDDIMRDSTNAYEGDSLRAKSSLETLPLDAEAGKMGSTVLGMLWPGWPPSLPSPAMLDHLVDTFFTMVPSVPRIIHRQSFLTRLALPPTHSDFPQRALLHAICACAARYSAAVTVRSVQDGIEKLTEDSRNVGGRGCTGQEPEDEWCFSERNAMYAMKFIKYNHVSARGLFEFAQALIILSHWTQANSRWMEGWVMTGTEIRLCVGLGLHQHQPSDTHAVPNIRRSILGPPENDAEREERRATIYYALCYDVTTSASSGWVGSMPYDELTARLPGPSSEFDKESQITENTQTYSSPDIFYNHPVQDSFVMFIKSEILLGRVCKFLRKFRSMEAGDRLLANSLPEFHQIEKDIALFLLAFPHSLRDPVQHMKGHLKSIDADLISAHLVPHIAAIQLHEPFADVTNATCSSAQRLLTESRACLNIVYMIISSSADVSCVVVPITSCNYLFVVARTLLLFYRQALENNDQASALIYHSEVSVLKMTLIAMTTRFSMAYRHLVMVEKLMQHIEEETLGRQVTNNDFTHQSHEPQTFASTAVYSQSSSVLAHHHPDSMMIFDLDKGTTTERLREIGLSSHVAMDLKRDYVGPHSGSNSTSGSGLSAGPSHNDSIGWEGMAGSQPGAKAMVLSLGEIDSVGESIRS
ncbi:uncharacterized protein L203_104291 [Cryptococcus depauperatus CBS 7841]|uniref:Uncharacterized protein n=1 Tax=Cryptococcus depauperatus CBS 7841 TaxID=1295531 RepID=A0A1E3I5U4_9TREE|nr:hypothetical protein L203_05297 [Cryptococcus depauperatus CBS 7841]